MYYLAGLNLLISATIRAVSSSESAGLQGMLSSSALILSVIGSDSDGHSDNSDSQFCAPFA